MEGQVGSKGGQVKFSLKEPKAVPPNEPKIKMSSQEYDELKRAAEEGPGEPSLALVMSLEIRMHLSPFISKRHEITMISEMVREGKMVHCIVGRIMTPGEFWVMPLQPYNALEKLMDAMQEVYNRIEKSVHLQRCIPAVGDIKIGTHLAVKLYGLPLSPESVKQRLDAEWHRCSVIGKTKKPKEGYMVRAIDFGDLKFVSREDMRFLFSQFADLKAQAIPCIAKISSFFHKDIKGRDNLEMLKKMDRGNGWTAEDFKRFKRLVEHRDLDKNQIVTVDFLGRAEIDFEEPRFDGNVRPWSVYVHSRSDNGRIDLPHVERVVFASTRKIQYSVDEVAASVRIGQKPSGVQEFKLSESFDANTPDYRYKLLDAAFYASRFIPSILNKD